VLPVEMQVAHAAACPPKVADAKAKALFQLEPFSRERVVQQRLVRRRCGEPR
jgi:hypothetical protein